VKGQSELICVLLVLWMLLLSILPLASVTTGFAASQPKQIQGQYPSGSWGLGVVLPEGSRFTNGEKLSWANTTSVSLTATLPNIAFTDYPILAVESLMVADGSVIQVAVGLYPNNTSWLGYGWHIRNVQATPQIYDWVLNSSQPEMAPSATIGLSIYMSQGMWRYRVDDLTTHKSTEGSYAHDLPRVLKVGDQEVFALESYSTNSVVFAKMGNLTLNSLRVNGVQITTGWYEYGSWDTRHNPLFVVGGLNPPPYLSMSEVDGSVLVWSYEQWFGPQPVEPESASLILRVVVPALAAIAVFSTAYVAGRWRSRGVRVESRADIDA